MDWDERCTFSDEDLAVEDRIESAYPSIGGFRRIRVVDRDGHGQWGGRVQRLRVVGSAGKVRVSGDDFRWTFGLRSNWFKVV